MFQDKWIWITGASSGIGKAAAQLWFAKGAKLILSARSVEKLESLKKELDPSGEKCKVLPLDLNELEQMSSKAEKALELASGHISLLFNNGGLSQRATALETKAEVLERLMRINFLSQTELTKVVLESMIRHKDGHIVVTSSVAGKIGTKKRSGYAATKHALHGYFDSLREEHYKDGISVTIVCPGYIKTDISLNAVKADGTPNNEMDSGQENGMPVEVFAQKMIKGIEAGKDEIYIGGKEVNSIYLKRYFPSLLKKIMRKVKYS